MIPLGQYPTAVQRVEGCPCAPRTRASSGSSATTARTTSTRQQGAQAGVAPRGRPRRGAKRVVTVGPPGVIMCWRRRTSEEGGPGGRGRAGAAARDASRARVLRADLALGLRAFPVGSWGAAPLALARRVASGARLIRWADRASSDRWATWGGTRAGGAGATRRAARAGGVRRGTRLRGTAGGLAAGFEAEGMRTRVVGVCVSTPPWVLRLTALWLARACARPRGSTRRSPPCAAA